MTGTAYFQDGHTEAISEAHVVEYSFHTEIEFATESGRYFFKSWHEWPETLYHDNTPIMHSSYQYRFYKLEWVGLDPEPRVLEVPIEKIELKEEE